MHEDTTNYIEQILEVTPDETTVVQPPNFHLLNHQN